MLVNPVTTVVSQLVQSQPDGISEYQLIQHLQDQQLIPAAAAGESTDLGLYRAHFLVMNALYQLQETLLERGLYLLINPLKIRLLPASQGDSQALIDDHSHVELRSYYTDWQHFASASNSSVEELLNSFWERYLATDQQLSAYQTLELSEQATWPEIRHQYQRLIKQHHPDKGGDNKRFIAVRSAYETLAYLHRS